MIADSVPCFDLAFIDADKRAYDAYYERCLKLVRPNGLIVVDNALWRGRVLGEIDCNDATALAIDALNRKLKTDPRVDAVLLPVGDGIQIIRVHGARMVGQEA